MDSYRADILPFDTDRRRSDDAFNNSVQAAPDDRMRGE
jgi:hypothetical protein